MSRIAVTILAILALSFVILCPQCEATPENENDDGFNLVESISGLVDGITSFIGDVVSAIVNSVEDTISWITSLISPSESGDDPTTVVPEPTVDPVPMPSVVPEPLVDPTPVPIIDPVPIASYPIINGIDISRLQDLESADAYLLSLAEIYQGDGLDNDEFIKDMVYMALATKYSVYPATLTSLSDNSTLNGLAVTDYRDSYADDAGKIYFSSGFVSFDGTIPDSEYILTSNDDTGFGFVFAYRIDNVHSHMVRDGTYIRYSVENSKLSIMEDTVGFGDEVKDNVRRVCDQSLGDLYSYDDEKYLLLVDGIGEYVPVSGSSLFKLIDYKAIETAISQQMARQDIDWVSIDVATVAYISEVVLNNYLNSLAQETFLGYPVSMIKDRMTEMDASEYLLVKPDGLYIEDLPPKLSTLDSIIKYASLVVAATCVVCTFVFPAAAPLTMGLAGSAVELFSELQEGPLSSVSPLKVVGMGVLGAMMGGCTSLVADVALGAAGDVLLTKIEGGSWEQAGRNGLNGALFGFAVGGILKAVEKTAKAAKSVTRSSEIPNAPVKAIKEANGVTRQLTPTTSEINKLSTIKACSYKSLKNMQNESILKLDEKMTMGAQKNNIIGWKDKSVQINGNIKTISYDFEDGKVIQKIINNKTVDIQIYNSKGGYHHTSLHGNDPNCGSVNCHWIDGNEIKVDLYSNNPVYTTNQIIPGKTLMVNGHECHIFKKDIFVKENGKLYKNPHTSFTDRYILKYMDDAGNWKPIKGKEYDNTILNVEKAQDAREFKYVDSGKLVDRTGEYNHLKTET